MGELAAYCLHDAPTPEDRSPETSERVAWTDTRNLPTIRAERVAHALEILIVDQPGSVAYRACTSTSGGMCTESPCPCARAEAPYVAARVAVVPRPHERRCRSRGCGRGGSDPPIRHTSYGTAMVGMCTSIPPLAWGRSRSSSPLREGHRRAEAEGAPNPVGVAIRAISPGHQISIGVTPADCPRLAQAARTRRRPKVPCWRRCGRPGPRKPRKTGRCARRP